MLMTTTTPDITGTIFEAIESDDHRANARLVRTYEQADVAQKEVIDDFLITLCGYSMPTILKMARGEPS